MYFKGSHLDIFFINYDVFLSRKVVLTLANGADPDEVQHYAAFYLGLHGLLNYPFRFFSVYRGFRSIQTVQLSKTLRPPFENSK